MQVVKKRRVVEENPVGALTKAGEEILRRDPARFARVLLLVQEIADAYENRYEAVPTGYWPANLDASADAC